MPGRQSTREDPNGVNLGNGITGPLDNPKEWFEDSVDLTPYAGRQILLRFEVVNDDAYVGDGFALDSISVPEIGWTDQTGDSGWLSEGFVRIQNSVPARLSARIVIVSGGVLTTFPSSEEYQGIHGLTVPSEVAAADRATIILANHTVWSSRPQSVRMREAAR